MERLQDKVEDTPVASQAVVKVVSAVAAFMAKNSGVAGLDKVSDAVREMVDEAVRRQSTSTATPARSVGCGGSMAGRPVVRLMREVVDQVSNKISFTLCNCHNADFMEK